MADVNRGTRPLSPHLQIYKLPITAITSILTRITGLIWGGAALLFVWWLLAAATSEGAFGFIDGLWTLPVIGWIIQLGALWAICYHTLAGIRHLYWDSGRGLDLATAEKLSKACLIGSAVLALLFFVIL